MSKVVFTSLRACLAALCLMSLAGCSTTLGRTGERVAGGTAVGAVAGTVVTVLTGGCIPCGAAIGASAGAGAGYIYAYGTRQSGR